MMFQRSAVSLVVKPLFLLTVVGVLLLLMINTGQFGASSKTSCCPEYFNELQLVKVRRTVDQRIRSSETVEGGDSETRINSSILAQLNKALDSVYLAVKTTHKFHNTRLQLMIDTWIQLAINNTWIFTDGNDSSIDTQLPAGHLVNTGCEASHKRPALVCKVSAVFDRFMKSLHNWLCIADDDTYLNIPQLVLLLNKYSHTQDWYLGKPTLSAPRGLHIRTEHPVKFWFATGGAGYCLSRSLATKMYSYIGENKLKQILEQTKLPDDVLMGYVTGVLCNVELTQIHELHSHLEPLWKIPSDQLRKQISLSYGEVSKRSQLTAPNVVNTDAVKDLNIFNLQQDPTRLRSIHCWLFPEAQNCSTH